jgi:hypothetical protein
MDSVTHAPGVSTSDGTSLCLQSNVNSMALLSSRSVEQLTAGEHCRLIVARLFEGFLTCSTNLLLTCSIFWPVAEKIGATRFELATSRSRMVRS